MALSKTIQEVTEAEPLDRDQVISSLRRYLTAEDRKKICQRFEISTPTYNRAIRGLDPKNLVFAAIVEQARLNKESEENTAAALKALAE